MKGSLKKISTTVLGLCTMQMEIGTKEIGFLAKDTEMAFSNRPMGQFTKGNGCMMSRMGTARPSGQMDNGTKEITS